VTAASADVSRDAAFALVTILPSSTK